MLCSATTHAGAPCRNSALEGSTLCVSHLRPSGGRPSLLTPELGDALIASLRVGNYLHVACRAVGISRQAFAKWMTRGRSGEPGDEAYADLRERVERARAEAEARHVSVITRAALDGSWQASAWLLEREYPDRWGRVSVRLRDEPTPNSEPAIPEDDPFSEVDELAQRRATHTA